MSSMRAYSVCQTETGFGFFGSPRIPLANKKKICTARNQDDRVQQQMHLDFFWFFFRVRDVSVHEK